MNNRNAIDNIKLIPVFDAVPVGMIILDHKTVILSANKSFANTYDVNIENISGKPIETIDELNIDNNSLKALIANNGEDIPEQKRSLLIKNKEGKSFLYEFSLIYPEKQHKPLYLGITKEGNSAFEIREELERQLELKGNIKDELDEKNELDNMKSRFLSIASHEFRTPLAGILSSLNLINRYILADEQTYLRFKNREKIINHIDKINESVKNLTTIINNFLALGNIEKGEIPVKFTSFNLYKMIAAQKSQFQELSKPGQKILYKHNSEQEFVRLDKYLFKNIMNNLISNAIKFSPEDSDIHISSTIDEDGFKMTIKDEGIGIPQAEQSKIFSRFYRAKNALNYQEGTGLGLNIVKNYVVLMNGSIAFESIENKGTTFYLTFPKKKNEKNISY